MSKMYEHKETWLKKVNVCVACAELESVCVCVQGGNIMRKQQQKGHEKERCAGRHWFGYRYPDEMTTQWRVDDDQRREGEAGTAGSPCPFLVNCRATCAPVLPIKPFSG